jgi:AraC-like DNA-binding protein
MPTTSLNQTVFNPEGLEPILSTTDFDQWSTVVGTNLGDHRSHLFTPCEPFQAVIHGAQVAGIGLLHLHGRGQVQLDRVQGPDRAVLWLPLQGLSEEVVNGEVLVAGPGMAMLLRPGDHLRGNTTRQMEGLSILIPSDRIQPGLPSLLHQGYLHGRLIAAGKRFAQAVSTHHPGVRHAATALLDQLGAWQVAMVLEQGGQRERITARRRRLVVANACQWMDDHLEEPFEVLQVAQAVAVSTRTLQYAFTHEKGVSPMAEAKRLRLIKLRCLLQDPCFADYSIAELMTCSGLLAGGSTAGDYRRYFGESPRHSRQR